MLSVRRTVQKQSPSGILTIGVSKSDGEGLRSGFAIGNVRGDLPHPASVRPNVGLQPHIIGNLVNTEIREITAFESTESVGRMLTGVVRAHFEGLVASHDKANLLGLLMGEEFDFTGATFLPFRIASVEAEELCSPARNHGWRLDGSPCALS